MYRISAPLRAGVLTLLIAVVVSPRPEAQSLPYALFERYLESLREQTGIPGLSATIVQGRRRVWEAGLGKQDLDRSVATRADTPFPIGDLTQSFAAVLVGQCVDATGLSIDQPIRRWTNSIPEASATIRHVLAHASTGSPGELFTYDPSRYATLTNVLDDCGSGPFRATVAARVFDRLGMQDSVPGADLADAASPGRREFDDATLSRYAAVLQRMATPYRVDRGGRASKGDISADVNAATGLVSTVQDLARFDVALDDGILLRRDHLAEAWTNVISRNGAALPAGLGWLVQTYNGERLVWHFGAVSNAASSLVLKVPGRDMTLILLANSDGLTAPYSLSDGDATTSLFAKLFLKLFVG